tara:strand:- start:1261 stop:1380 length:120 start_codon:yes stop_codon:yes gene_type:complete
MGDFYTKLFKNKYTVDDCIEKDIGDKYDPDMIPPNFILA